MIGSKLIAQMYDAISVIAGDISSANVRVIEKYKEALFIHCTDLFIDDVDNDGRALARSLSRLCQRHNMQDRVEISIILSFYL